MGPESQRVGWGHSWVSCQFAMISWIRDQRIGIMKGSKHDETKSGCAWQWAHTTPLHSLSLYFFFCWITLCLLFVQINIQKMSKGLSLDCLSFCLGRQIQSMAHTKLNRVLSAWPSHANQSILIRVFSYSMFLYVSSYVIVRVVCVCVEIMNGAIDGGASSSL